MIILTYIRNLFWRLVFFWKKRTGWLDLSSIIEITGTVIYIESSTDGDANFDVLLDPGQDKHITGFGGRLTCADSVRVPSIHCEITPWASDELHLIFSRVRKGMRVKVKGRWGFDGVHLGRSMWIEVPMALLRHQPNVKDGWFEIHPVEELSILD